ncbi:MAG: DUF1538 domain-containing protein [Candidatus Bathyarchaeota archaeon]|nr:DUF1538 domain-containing protein [Candidatus Termiticorpusculum sp.]
MLLVVIDSGCVATGPLSIAFLLSLAQGASDAIPSAILLVDAFGVITTVAITPLIALEILGLIYKFQINRQERKNG